MKKVLLGLMALYGHSKNSVGQSGLYLSASTYFSVQPATIVSVNGLVLTPSSDFIISGPNSLERVNSIAHTAPQKHLLRVFKFDNSTAPFDGDVAFYYHDNELNGIEESALTLNTHNGSIWQYHPVNSRDATSNIVTSTVQSGLLLNELTLADLAAPLPVSWGSVSAFRTPQGSLIQWHTYNESNIAHFKVEYSLDGIAWIPLANSIAPHNYPGSFKYAINDATITNAKTYYRIRLRATSGQLTYSKVVTVHALPGNTQFDIYPNPSTGIVTIKMSMPSITGIKLFDAKGRLQQQRSLSKVSKHTLDLRQLPKGTYFLEILTSTKYSCTQTLIIK